LVQGNRAILSLLGFAIPIVGVSLWHAWRDDCEHTD
jgi:hypothetical protein